MELKDFIKLALTEICDGIAEARTDIESKYQGNCIIAPVTFQGKMLDVRVREILFDVAVELGKENSKNGNGKINILNNTMGGDFGKKSSEKKINRITFSVPFFVEALRMKKTLAND